MADKGAGRISAQDWEQIFNDFRGSAGARNKWLSQHTPAGLLDQALQATSRKDFHLKLQVLAFIDENAGLLLHGGEDSAADAGLALLVESLRATLQTSTAMDGSAAVVISFKEQMMATVTSAMITTEALHSAPRCLEPLVELLLNFINRPNHSADRHLRATACECLRELEQAYPCLLHQSAGHLLLLCQGERTHAGQSYTLLLAAILRNLALGMQQVRGFYSSIGGSYSILSTTVPLVPFSVPTFLTSANNDGLSSSYRDFSYENIKEFRRAVSFLLERPNLLTECALSEFISDLSDIATCLDLQASLLKIQFSNLLHVYSPVCCHALLTIFTRFPDAFEGEEVVIYKRLVHFCREFAQPLTVRLLAMHWLQGMENILVSRARDPVLPSVARSLYPQVFDPLALKAAKMDCLARCAATLDSSFTLGGLENGGHSQEEEEELDAASKLFKDGLACLSAYRWLPPHSTETRLMFHVLHSFLIAGIPHCKKKMEDGHFVDSLLFKTLQGTLVKMARNVRRLVDMILALLDRFLSCDTHHSLGERLLRTFSEDLVPCLPANLHLPAYFSLIERIAESSKIPPGALIESLASYLRHRVAADSGNEDARLWLRGSEVLAICRTVLMHHQSSRVFHKLTALLGFMCRFFPDIEVRDSARFYLRMLISVPGKRLREILLYGDERMEDSKPQLLHVSSFLSSHSPRAFKGKMQILQVSSFIHLTRENPLLVQSSWSLVLHDSFQPSVKTFTQDEKADVDAANDKWGEPNETQETTEAPAAYLNSEQVPRMMDAKTTDILALLRRHFSEVPDSGIKIEVLCRLRLKLEASQQPDSPSGLSDLAQSCPAIYAVVITFSTSGSYGPIPSVHVPFLLSEPAQRSEHRSVLSPRIQKTGQEAFGEGRSLKLLDIEGKDDETHSRDNMLHRFSELVKIELEPKQPVPTLVDCHIVFSDEDAQTIQGPLDSIAVGIEDLFMKPHLPADVSSGTQAEYLYSLFNALWFACSGPGKLGSETFLLKGGRQGLGIQGSESVKLLEAQADRVVGAVENYIAQFVVSVSGSALVSMARDSGKFENTYWMEEEGLHSQEVGQVEHGKNEDEQLKLEYSSYVDSEVLPEPEKDELGCFLVLIFLPPRYHLLLRMEVSDWSTLVRIRTDYWPSLAHIDEFLESFTIPRMSSL